MPRLPDLYNIKITQDIILSDFGRDAAIRYLSYFSDLEKNKILQYLGTSEDFLDEYRRVAICLIGDLSFIKAPVLKHYYEQQTPFDNKILVGFNPLFPYEELKRRIAMMVFHQILVAINLGHSRIRVVIPCNTLSPVGWYMKDLLHNLIENPSGLTLLTKDEKSILIEKSKYTQIYFPTIPEIVLNIVTQNGCESIYIFGTPDTLEIYQKAIIKSYSNIKLIMPASSDQEIISQAILNSIDGRDGKIKMSYKNIIKFIVDPMRSKHPNIQFIEACTDLNLGIGLNSSNLYVSKLVDEIYTS